MQFRSLLLSISDRVQRRATVAVKRLGAASRGKAERSRHVQPGERLHKADAHSLWTESPGKEEG